PAAHLRRARHALPRGEAAARSQVPAVRHVAEHSRSVDPSRGQQRVRCAGAGRGRARGGARLAVARVMSTRTILLWCEEPQPYIDATKKAGLADGIEFVAVPPRENPPDDVLARASALVSWRPPAGLPARAPKLEWIQSLTGGVEGWLASPDLPAPNVPLCCARGTHRSSMPENILAALFA